MANSRYSGTVTTSGNSEAIRLENALFKAHPEFRQKGKVTATVIAPGQLLISVADEPQLEAEDDPVIEAFLAFLAGDLRRRPDRLQPLRTSAIERGVKLTEGIEVDDSEAIPDDISL